MKHIAVVGEGEHTFVHLGKNRWAGNILSNKPDTVSDLLATGYRSLDYQEYLRLLRG